MNPQVLMSAIPWVRRAWRMAPPALRPLLLLAGAAAGVWFAMQGRRELQEIEEREARGG